MTQYFIVNRSWHQQLVEVAFSQRGYDGEECLQMARLCDAATRNGIRTHNFLKALHLDNLFGSKVGGCVPGARIEKRASRFSACEHWDANRKLGPSVGWKAIERCIELADTYGTGTVSVNNAWHYLWGGAYVLEAASKGYIAYTNCTAMLAEVAPFGGVFPTLGTNPHSWAFPTESIIGFPVLVDWATSAIAMGRAQQLARENQKLPPGVAVDAQGQITDDPNNVAALLPFGRHKGFGLGLINELFAGWIGGSVPTIRGRYGFQIPKGERQSCAFYFQVIHPEAIQSENFAQGRSVEENVSSILKDILGHGNDQCLIPGQLEARMKQKSDEVQGLLFTQKEIEELNRIAKDCGLEITPLKDLAVCDF